MKIIKQWCPALLALILCGCFQVEDELNLQADGSGTIRLKVHSMIPEEAADMAGMGIGGGVVMYPPADEAEARRFFPRKDFTLKVEEKAEKEGKTVLIEAAFKDVNALLASPYGRAHQLVLQTNQSGAFKVQALSGGEAVGRFANFEPEGEMAAIPMPGMQDLQKNKEKMR